jgi:hypothetical protein
MAPAILQVKQALMADQQSTPEKNGFKVKMDLPGAIFFLLLGGYIFLAAENFPDIGWKMGGSPAFYPRILAFLMMVFTAAMYGKSRKAPKTADFPGPRTASYMLICLAACLIMPLVLLPALGFRISAFIFMFLLMLANRGKIRRPAEALKLAGYSLLVSGIIYGAFTHLARVRLPLGRITGW